MPIPTYRVSDFGADPSGQTLCTASLQQALDHAGAAGGGHVRVSAGIYLTGSLFVPSKVELHLEAGAELRGIQDESAYPDLPSRVAGIEMVWPAALVNLYDVEGAALTGEGVINGQGDYWWNKYWGPDEQGGMLADYDPKGLRWAVDYDCKRPRNILVFNARNIRLQGLTIKRSGFWNVHVCYSDQVVIDGLKICENFGPSSDGIDIDSSCNVLVQNCVIDCNDDGICLKAGRDADGLRVNRPCEKIVIRNCEVGAGHGIFTIGSETSGGIRDVEVYNIKARGTWIGISFKSAKTRGGVIENIHIHDIEMIDVPRPFRFVLNWMPSYSYCAIPPTWQGEIPAHWQVLAEPVLPPERGMPHFYNIRFSRITVNSRGCSARLAEPSSSVGMHTPEPTQAYGFDIEGFPEQPFEGFHWEDIHIDTDRPGKIANARNWTMQNVVLATPGAQACLLNNCQSVDQPEYRE